MGIKRGGVVRQHNGKGPEPEAGVVGECDVCVGKEGKAGHCKGVAHHAGQGDSIAWAARLLAAPVRVGLTDNL